MFLSLDRLLLTFDIVILPSFDTAAMSRKKRWGRKRRISNVVVRRMVSLRFASFRDKLVAAAKNTNCTVFTDVCEAWTSKVSQVYFVLWVVIHVATPIWFVSQTCGNWECGKIHTKLGASKVFKCPACGHEEDRDAGAARKVYISWLYEAFQQVCCCCLVMFFMTLTLFSSSHQMEADAATANSTQESQQTNMEHRMLHLLWLLLSQRYPRLNMLSNNTERRTIRQCSSDARG